MRIKIISLFFVSALVLLMTGCDKGQAQMGPRETNLLGIAKVERESYTHTGLSTFAVETDELYDRNNFSGDKYTFLWGLITIRDY